MIGQKVGNYVIEGNLGRGGMGVVYRARHVMLGRPAAIKVLLPQFSSQPDVVQRFFNEAKAATSIRHLGIVEIYDFGLLDTGVAFIAMELLAGESLATRMARRAMSLHSCLGLIRQICGALGAAHELGIVHRDLKPDNVFLISDAEVHGGERIKLLDFGIAKLSQDSSELANQTRTGTLIGTPKYMAPEQCRGVKVDHRADIYSLGCILYELITGRTPFRGEGAGDVLAAHIYATPEPIEKLAPGTPRAIVRLVGRLLAKNPDARPQTTRQLIHEIDELGVISFSEDVHRPSVGVEPEGVPPTQRTGVPTVIESARARARGDRTPAEDASAPRTTLSGAVASAQMHNTVRRRRLRLVALGAALGASGAALFVLTRTDGRSSGTAVGAPRVASVPADATVATPQVTEPLARDAGVALVAVLDAAPAAPVAPAMVHVVLDSEPPGAHVWLDGADLGVTPYAGTLPKMAHEVVFSLRRERFKDYAIKATATADIRADVRLVARGTDSGHPAAAHKGTVGTTPIAPGGRPPAPPHHVSLGDDDTPNPLGAH